MAEVKEEDLRFIRRLRERDHLLVDVDSQVLKGMCKDGVIVFGCGDGDQSVDMLVTHLMQKVDCAHRPHLAMYDGGAINLIEPSLIPEKYRFSTEKIINRLELIRRLKRISTILIYSHYPCGMAAEAKVPLPMIIYYNLEAVQILRRKGWDRKRIVPLFHVDYGRLNKNTYYIEKEKQGSIFIKD